MKYKFMSSFTHPTLIVKPLKSDRDGNIQQEAQYIQFDNHFFQTDDEELAEHIKKQRNFGADYWEVNEAPVGEKKGLQIAQMNTKEQDLEKKVNEELSGIKSQINSLADIVNNLVNVVSKPAREVSGEEAENAKDEAEDSKKKTK